MQKVKLGNFSTVYAATLLAVVLFAFAAAYLEYNYILSNGLPFREAKAPVALNLYAYDWVLFVPVMLLLSFSPLIYMVLQKAPATGSTLKRHFAFGTGSFLFGLMIKDAGWFAFRTFAPLSTDPLAHQWIRPSDYTASVLGSAQLFGVTLPLWYFAFLPLIVAIFISLVISGPASEPPSRAN